MLCVFGSLPMGCCNNVTALIHIFKILSECQKADLCDMYFQGVAFYAITIALLLEKKYKH